MSIIQTRNQDPARAREYFQDRLSFSTGPVELKRMINDTENMTVIDVRDPEDYEAGHIPGAINLPREQWRTFAGLQKRDDWTHVVYCYNIVCHLATVACLDFARAGYPVMELEGGFDTWQEFGFPVEK